MSEAESDAPSSSPDLYPDPSRDGTRRVNGREGSATTRRGVLAGLGSILTIPGITADLRAATAVSQHTGWPQYHGNARRTGQSGAGNPEEPTRTRWSLEVAADGEGRQNRTAPVVAGGTMFTANADGNLVAVDVPSGTVEWSYTAAGGVQIAPTVGDGRVFLGTGDGDMVALDRENGDEQWSVGTGGGVSAPAVLNGNVYFGQSGGDTAKILSFDAASGDLRWQTDVSTTGSLPYPSAMTVPTPAVGGDRVVANVQNLEDAGGSGLVALDSADGTEQWQTSLGDVCYPPSLTDNTGYAITDTSVNRVSITDGSVRWETVFEPLGMGSGLRITPDVVTIGENTVYVQEPTGNGELGFVALNARTGEREWSYATDSVPSVGSGVSTAGSLVYFALQGELVAVDAESGLEEWTYRLTEDVPEGRVPNEGRRSGSAPIPMQDGILVKHLGTVHTVDDRSTQGSEGGSGTSSVPSGDDGGSGDSVSGDGSETQVGGSQSIDENSGFRLFDRWRLTLVSIIITAIAALITAVSILLNIFDKK